jgi:hypothetical protein
VFATVVLRALDVHGGELRLSELLVQELDVGVFPDLEGKPKFCCCSVSEGVAGGFTPLSGPKGSP